MRWLLLLGLMVPLACGPSVEDSGDDDGSGSDTDGSSGPATSGSTSTSSVSTTSTSSTVSSTTSSTSDGVTSTPPTTTSSTGTASSGVGTTTSPDTDGTSTGIGECIDDGVYRAESIIGALDRVRIYRRDDERDTCFWLSIYSPAEGSMYDVVTTPPWALEQVWWNNDAASCDTQDPGAAGSSPVPDASGTIDLELGPNGYPCSIRLDLELQLLENPDPPVFMELCQQLDDLDGCAP